MHLKMTHKRGVSGGERGKSEILSTIKIHLKNFIKKCGVFISKCIKTYLHPN